MTLVLLLLLGIAAGYAVRRRIVVGLPIAVAAVVAVVITASGDSLADTPLVFTACVGTAGVVLGQALCRRAVTLAENR